MEIREKIDELRELFRQQFGVDVDIKVNAHNITRDLANHISLEIANAIEPKKIWQYHCSQYKDIKWVSLLTKDGFEYAGFY
jgi:hypothetical protein